MSLYEGVYQLYHKQKHRTNRSHCFGMSMDLNTIKKIDRIRGDVPRSRWIQRAMESLAEVSITLTEGNKNPLKSVKVGRHTQTPADSIVSTPVKESNEL